MSQRYQALLTRSPTAGSLIVENGHGSGKYIRLPEIHLERPQSHSSCSNFYLMQNI
jgi:hypothetical protein